MIIERGRMKDGSEYIIVEPSTLIDELKNLKTTGLKGRYMT